MAVRNLVLSTMRVSSLSGVVVFLFAAVVACSDKETSPPEALEPVPSEAQLQWHAMEMNAFIHFTTNTFTDKEWGYGDESPMVFNPSDIDVDQWITTLKDAGFKGVILTTKHHDGFCLWPSRYTGHTVASSPFEGDVVKMVSESCREHGLRFGIYLSPWDRNRADYGTPAYIEYYRNQLEELFTNYGPVFEMWFDGANGGDGYYGGAREHRRIDGSTYYDWPETLSLVREMEPDVIFFSDAGPGVRWVGNERGVAGVTNWNTITPDTLFAGKAGIEELLNTGSKNGTHWIPAETDVSIRPGWFYHAREDSLVKSPERLFEIYLTSVGRGSTLLLNVPPDRRGKFHENDIAALKGFRAILDSVFRKDLALDAIVWTEHFRGGDERYAATMVNDNDPETYWATDDDQHHGSLILDFDDEKRVSYVMMQEYIRLGQRVTSFKIDIWKDENWVNVSRGTTIGYKRIMAIEPIETRRIRITIDDAKECPLISNVSVY